MLDFASTFAPALVAGLLVLSTHAPLGREVLRSGIVFLDLAVAQAAGLGVVLAGLAFDGEAGVLTHALALGAALLAGAALAWTERRAGGLQEALIGSFFVVVASLSPIALAANPYGGERLRELLVGQIIWVTWGDLWPAALVSATTLGLWFVLGPRLGRAGFYALFAVAVTVSVQLVGVYLVFASLILPALPAHGLPARAALRLAYAVGVAGYGFGFVATFAFDLPAGPAIVCALAFAAAAAQAVARRKAPG